MSGVRPVRLPRPPDEQGVGALPDVDDVTGASDPRGRVSTVRYQEARHGGDGESQRDGDPHDCGGPGEGSDVEAELANGTRCPRSQQDQRGNRGHPDQYPLCLLCTDAADQEERYGKSADDRADRVGRIHPPDEVPSVLSLGGYGRQGERKAKAPEHRSRCHGQETPHEIDLEVVRGGTGE